MVTQIYLFVISNNLYNIFFVASDNVNALATLLRVYSGSELLESSTDGSDSLLKMLWHHSNAIMCCTTTVCTLNPFFYCITVKSRIN